MADGTIEILIKHKLQERRRKCNNIFSLAMNNTSSNTLTANIFDNKGGFSGANVYNGYSQSEISSWNSDGADRVIALFWNPLVNKMCAIRTENSWTNQYVYSIDNNTLVPTLEYTTPFTFTRANNGTNATIFNPFDNYFYQYYYESPNGFIVERSNGDLTGSPTGYRISSTTPNIQGVALKESTGEMLLIDRTTQRLIRAEAAGVPVIQNISLAADIYRVQYIPQTDETWIFGEGNASGKSELIVVDSSNTVTRPYTDSTNTFYGSNMVVVGDNVISFHNTPSGVRMIKWDVFSKSIVFDKVLSGISNPFALGNYITLDTDEKQNFYLQTSSILHIFDINGSFLGNYKTSDRTVFGGGSGFTYLLGSPQFRYLVNQKFNPVTQSLFIGGSIQSVFSVGFQYSGGLSGLVLNSSSSDYQMAVTEFNTEPILITGLLFYYKNGGVSLDKLIKYLKETSTGACERKVFQPRSFINATDSTDKVVEMDLCKTPLLIDSPHYLSIDIPQGEEITMVMFYRQAEKKDLLINKILG